jgi:hypothetical protein
VKDLFGEEIREPVLTSAGKVKRKPTLAHGYAAPPGMGPENETCGTCAHSHSPGGHAKNYWKCALVRHTNGPATDIRLRSPACRLWKLDL